MIGQRHAARLNTLIVAVALVGVWLAPTGSAATTVDPRSQFGYDQVEMFSSSPGRGTAAKPALGLSPRTAMTTALRVIRDLSLAAKAGDGALRAVTALTREQDAALAAAMRDPNKLRHIFGRPQHNLGPITQELGGQEALMREAVLAVPRGTTGTFEVTKRIGSYDLTVRGRVVNGVPRIGTVFVP